MPELDIARCIRGCFAHHDTMTPEQRELAEDMIHDGPPNNTHSVVLRWPPGAAWDNATNTITRAGVVVQLRRPARWHGSEPSQAPVSMSLTVAHPRP